MDFLLRPGMTLMRRLSTTSKFGLVSLLLLIPMLTATVTAYQSSTNQITIVSREMQGMQLVQPLTELAIELCRTRGVGDSASPNGDWRTLVAKVDAADAQFGNVLAVHEDWVRLRTHMLATYSDGLKPAQRAAAAQQNARSIGQLLKQVADASQLVLDSHLNTYYLGAVLVDRLPHLIETATDAQSLDQHGYLSGAEQGSLTAQLAAHDLNDASQRLARDVTAALTAGLPADLHESVRSANWELSSAVAAMSIQLTTPAKTSDTSPETASQYLAVNRAAIALNLTLSQAMDELLSSRHEHLMRQRLAPLMLTLIAMTIAFYLMMSLFRAIATDARSVLMDISSVTSGQVHQNDPLTSADEFGQMSRAVIYARDRLTALVGALKYQATHDDLTALANRALFNEKVDEAIQRRDGPIAVLLVDLDGFKDLNDSFGHDFGDRLLRMVAARIHRNLPRRSVVARLGSDEFAVLITDKQFIRQPAERVAQLAETLAQPLMVDGRSMRMQAGIGYALAETRSAPGQREPNQTESGGDSNLSVAGHTSTSNHAPATVEPADDNESLPALPRIGNAVEMIRNADVALSYAKQLGKGNQVRFEARMHDHTRNRTELSADLIMAVDRGELFVVYQPLVDLLTYRIYGVEALVRWRHPVRGLVSPEVFIPLAEATGQITDIGRWVLQRACEDLAAWGASNPQARHLTMEVNLATEQLTDPSLVADVQAIIVQNGIEPKSLVLEITESALVKDLETAMQRMAQLSALGVRIALDDFGTGYSSLSYLRRLPVTVMKIDKSFMRDDTPQGRALLRSIVDLGTGQGMQIVAEGVELPSQAERIRRAGCHIGQGHLWAPAVPAEHIQALLAAGGQMGPQPTTLATVPRPRVHDDATNELVETTPAEGTQSPISSSPEPGQ